MKVFTKWSRPVASKNHKRGYNQVAYVRHGKDRVIADGNGGNFNPKAVKTVWVTTRSGEKWEIPVDDDGKVPNAYLFARFLSGKGTRSETGRRDPGRDIGIDAEVLHEIPKDGFTPQQLIETGWWQYPNESDIVDIDDTGALSFARQLEQAGKSARNAGKEMVFLMDQSEADRARSILSRDFTGAELNKAVRNGGIIIMEGNPGRGSSGCYVPVQTGSSVKAPIIILRSGWDEETLVHEFTHHMRHVDPTRDGLTRTPFRLNEQGERDSFMTDQKDFNSCRNLEEAATVGESLVRLHQPSDGPNGYFALTKYHGDTAKERWQHDTKLLGSVPKKGRAAENRLKQKFGETSISHLKAYTPGSNATTYLRARTSAGTMPKGQKAVRKKKSDASVAPRGSRPTATAMKRSAKKRK